MSASLIRFECYIPVATSGTNADTAINNFIANMQSLANTIEDTCYMSIAGVQTYTYRVYGFITSAQSSTALGYLNNLISVIGNSVMCTTNNVTTQP